MNAARTASQTEASKTNGAMSHGPVTDEGKARSSQNAMKHGLFSEKIIIPGESEDDFDQLSAAIADRWKPANFDEEERVRELVILRWRLRRCASHEARLASAASPEEDERAAAENWFRVMDRVSKLHARLRRLEATAEQTLREMQEARRTAEEQQATYREQVKDYLVGAGVMTDRTEATATVEQLLGVERLPLEAAAINRLVDSVVARYRQNGKKQAA